MAKLSKFATNLSAAKTGIEVDMGDGFSVRIAKADNEQYQKYMRQVLKPFQQQVKNGSLPDSTFEKLYNEALAETVVLDWKGLEDDSGVEIPYSKEAAIKLLSDPELAELKKSILEIANTASAYSKEFTEDTK